MHRNKTSLVLGRIYMTLSQLECFRIIKKKKSIGIAVTIIYSFLPLCCSTVLFPSLDENQLALP